MTFDSLQWSKAKNSSDDIVRSIRHDVRKFRREKGRAGHRFRFATLKNIWYVDQVHAVVNHTDDPVWQYWYNDPQDGWMLVHWYSTRREAQAAAELPHPESVKEKLVVADKSDGHYVLVAWPNKDFSMRYHCSSPYTAQETMKVWEKLGCRTVIEGEEVSLPEPSDDSKDVATSLSTPNFDESVTREDEPANV